MAKIVSTTLEEAEKVQSTTNWARVDAMSDEDILCAIENDHDSVPELTEDWFKKAHWVEKGQEAIPVYLDHEVVNFLRRRGANYHFWLNGMLKDLMHLVTDTGSSAQCSPARHVRKRARVYSRQSPRS